MRIEAGSYFVTDFETIVGGHLSDTMTGGGGTVLGGGAGEDTLSSTGDADTLIGGPDPDHLAGVDPNDVLSFFDNTVASYATSSAPISFEFGLNGRTFQIVNDTTRGDGAGDTLSNIVVVEGSNQGDVPRGHRLRLTRRRSGTRLVLEP